MVRKKQHRKLTAAERVGGARFKEVRLQLRPDLAPTQTYGEELDPPVTAQTVRNWQLGWPIPPRMMRANCKLLGCDPKVFFDPPGTPIGPQRREEHLDRLRSDAQMGLTYEIATALEATNGPELIEGWAQKYQALGDHETAEYIRSEAIRMSEITARGDEIRRQEDAEQEVRDRRLMLLAMPKWLDLKTREMFHASIEMTLESLRQREGDPPIKEDEVHRTRFLLITLMHGVYSEGCCDPDDFAEGLIKLAMLENDAEMVARIEDCLDLMRANLLPGWNDEFVLPPRPPKKVSGL